MIVSEGLKTDFATAMRVEADRERERLAGMLATYGDPDSGPAPVGAIAERGAAQARGLVEASRVKVELYERTARESAASGAMTPSVDDVNNPAWFNHPAVQRWRPLAMREGLFRVKG